MKSLNLNNSSNLSKLKEELNKIFDDRIEKAKLNEEVSSLGDMPLGTIINVFELTTDKLYESANGKKLIGQFVKSIRKNKSIAEAYSVYELIRKSENATYPQLFLGEAISIANGISKKEYCDGKKELSKIVKECISEAGIDAATVKNKIAESSELCGSIEYLVLNKKTYSNLNEYVSRFGVVCESIKSKKRKVKSDISANGSELVDMLNEEISGLNEWETSAMKDISIALLSESGMSPVFDKYKNECVEKIDSALGKAENIEESSHFESMKAQLLEKEYSNDTAYEDIFTLAELSHTLSE